ncbi:MAG: hypothetical protein RLZZ546_302, partial [Bacteroidota bacterium]
IFVYYINQTNVEEEKIVKIVKDLKSKKNIMGTLDLIEKRGFSEGEKRGISIGEKKVQEEIVVNSFKKGFDIKSISKITQLSAQKIRAILKKSGLI